MVRPVRTYRRSLYQAGAFVGGVEVAVGAEVEDGALAGTADDDQALAARSEDRLQHVAERAGRVCANTKLGAVREAVK